MEVPADDACPDSVFVEDTAVVVGGRAAVVTRPGAPSRRPEVTAVESTLRELGLTLHHVEPPGTLEGGDVLKVGDTVYVGRGGRTTVIGHPPLVDDPDVFPRFLSVPEESGSHVVLLDDRRLLMAADAPQTAELFRHQCYEPVCVDVSEFQKLEGCVTCLSIRVRS